MNDSQWLWEYFALKEKEKQQTDTTIEIVSMARRILISLLGLDLMKSDPVPGEEKVETEKSDSFMPLSLMTGRREVVEMIVKSFDQQEKIKKALEDENFEQISQSMAAGNTTDMDPILEQIDTNAILKKDFEEQMRRVGVKIVDQTHDVPHVDVKFKNKAGLKIKFDDNG